MTKFVSRRQFLKSAAFAAAAAAASAQGIRAFAQGGTPTATPNPLPPPPAAGPIDLNAIGGMDKLVELAQQEAELSTIALPNDWANYGKMKTDFFAKYPFLKYNDLSPDASSGDEIEAIRANAGNKGPQNPDVIDVGFIWGSLAKSQGLLQPYKVATWDSIPAEVKDADGYYYGNYYGTMVFEVNTDVVQNVPQDWNDLLKPEYKGQIAISGDPTSASQGLHAVWAAAVALSGGKIDDTDAGLEFFRKLAESGNLLPTPITPAGLAKGETPIGLRWDYNALSGRDANKDVANIEVVYPKSGSIAGVYLNGISAYAPRPYAARLWQEYIYSDEGQLTYLSGYATPIRFADLQEKDAISDELLAALPKSDITVAFPAAADIEKVSTAIRAGWPEQVGFEFSN